MTTGAGFSVRSLFAGDLVGRAVPGARDVGALVVVEAEVAGRVVGRVGRVVDDGGRVVVVIVVVDRLV